MPQINREGQVYIHGAKLSIMEEGLGPARDAGGYKAAQKWERDFKRDVFKRIIQQLNRIGWTVGPWDDADLYNSKSFAEAHRTCSKGPHLRALLSVSGRCISLEIWQSANTPTRPDHNGRYESDIMGVAPYLICLEILRTQNRIRDYLCAVFSGYEFKSERSDGRQNKHGPGHLTAMEWVQGCYETSWHFQGDISTYVISDYNRKSADGVMLEHGQRVWFFDRKGRCCTGIAMYNINNMWWVITGKYDVTNEACFYLYAACPENPRFKRNADLRRKRLEGQLSKAVAAMDFARAQVIKDLLFPPDAELFTVWHNEHGAYHRSGFCGYTKDINQAGKFLRHEVEGFDREPNKIMALGAA